jgi:hypothetical protein
MISSDVRGVGSLLLRALSLTRDWGGAVVGGGRRRVAFGEVSLRRRHRGFAAGLYCRQARNNVANPKQSYSVPRDRHSTAGDSSYCYRL